MDISERIKASGKLNRQIGEEVGVSTPVVWKWRRGHTMPNLANVAALAESLGCEPADLIPPRQ